VKQIQILSTREGKGKVADLGCLAERPNFELHLLKDPHSKFSIEIDRCLISCISAARMVKEDRGAVGSAGSRATRRRKDKDAMHVEQEEEDFPRDGSSGGAYIAPVELKRIREVRDLI